MKLFNSIKKNVSKSQRRIISNFFSLSVLEVVNYLIPIFLIPYLIKIFGISKFGEYMFALSFIQYFVILIDFGFNYVATREIAKNRLDKNKISTIFSSVSFIKLILLGISFVVFLGIINVFEIFEDTKMFLLIFGIIIGHAFFPLYIFQGLERMKKMVIINVFPKLISLFLILLLVKNNEDFYIFIFITSLGYVVSGVIGFLYVLIYYANIQKTSWSSIKNIFIISKDVFFANSASTLYLNSNTFILGFVSGFNVVGIYSVAEKTVRVTRYIVTPLTQALFPHYSLKFSNQVFLTSKLEIYNLAKKITPFLVVIVLGLFIFVDYIVGVLYGVPNPEISNCIYIMGLVIIIGTYNNILGVLGYVNLDLEKKFRNLILYTGIFNLIMITILGYKFGYIGGAITFLLSEIVLFSLLNKNFKIN